MDKHVVALVPCQGYEESAVKEALHGAMDLLGGMNAFVGPEQKVLLKPNLLSPAAPSRAITTHPAVFRAAAELLLEAGHTRLSYGDSPSGTHAPSLAARSAGLAAVAVELGIATADFTDGRSVQYEQGSVCKSFTLCNGVLDADAIVNICKMKTHALERITGAVKNLLGCVLGLSKGRMHARYPSAERFARMLVDLNLLLKPRLHILDGVVAMEGNGPASGVPVPMRVLLASGDPVALDAVFCQLIGLDPELVPTNLAGERAGLGVWRTEAIDIRTPDGPISAEEAFKRYGNPSFDVDRGGRTSPLRAALRFRGGVGRRPVLVKERCVRCGVCEENCPVSPKAVTLTDGGYPMFQERRCIRCFCCQEMCPAKAITVQTKGRT